MLNWLIHPVRKWNEWRLNRWLSLRKSNSNDVALKKAFLTKDKAFDLLYNLMMGHLGGVGVMNVNAGVFSGTDFNQLTLVMESLADLAKDMPEKDQVKNEFNVLLEHNWGGVRRAAAAGLQKL